MEKDLFINDNGICFRFPLRRLKSAGGRREEPEIIMIPVGNETESFPVRAKWKTEGSLPAAREKVA